jgi:hypothetical protein
LEAISEERNQHMRLGPMLELMIEGPDAQLTFQRAKDGFNLRPLHLARPQHRWILAGQITAQQVMTVALFGRFQLGLVQLKGKRRGGDRFVFWWQTKLHQPERTARFFLGGSDPQPQLIAFRQALAQNA